MKYDLAQSQASGWSRGRLRGADFELNIQCLFAAEASSAYAGGCRNNSLELHPWLCWELGGPSARLPLDGETAGSEQSSARKIDGRRFPMCCVLRAACLCLAVCHAMQCPFLSTLPARFPSFCDSTDNASSIPLLSPTLITTLLFRAVDCYCPIRLDSIDASRLPHRRSTASPKGTTIGIIVTHARISPSRGGSTGKLILDCCVTSALHSAAVPLPHVFFPLPCSLSQLGHSLCLCLCLCTGAVRLS